MEMEPVVSSDEAVAMIMSPEITCAAPTRRSAKPECSAPSPLAISRRELENCCSPPVMTSKEPLEACIEAPGLTETAPPVA